MPLQVKEAGNLADDNVLWRISKLLPNTFARFVGVQERFHVHAAVDRGEFLAWGDAALHHQFRHGVGHADDGMATAGGVPLAPAEERSRHNILKGMKRRSMHRV